MLIASTLVCLLSSKLPRYNASRITRKPMKGNESISQETPRFEDLTTRGRLAKILNVTTRSIANYHSLALDCVDDYFEDFPKVLGKRITNFRLSKYQSWVIWKLKTTIDITKNSDLIKQALINDVESQKLFSKQEFLSQQLEVDTNEFEGIRISK